jgi:sulfopyruvate decarboxylase subunit alpha
MSGDLTISGPAIASLLDELGITHVVWLPDTALGAWEAALEQATAWRLVRVCREGEAWAIAAGLILGGARPLVVMQSTGLFESGDSLRNVLFDLGLPVFAIVGHRSAADEKSTDTARRFTEPILQAWGLDYVTVAGEADLPRLAEHYRRTQSQGAPGVALVAEAND